MIIGYAEVRRQKLYKIIIFLEEGRVEPIDQVLTDVSAPGDSERKTGLKVVRRVR